MIEKEEMEKELIKSFLYLPIKLGVNHRILCKCGQEMNLKMSGASFSGGTSGFECIYCGNKLFLVWEFVKEFPHPYDKVRMVITKFNKIKEKEK